MHVFYASRMLDFRLWVSSKTIFVSDMKSAYNNSNFELFRRKSNTYVEITPACCRAIYTFGSDVIHLIH